MNKKLAELGSQPLSTSPAVTLRPLSLFEFLASAKLTPVILDDQYHESGHHLSLFMLGRVEELNCESQTL